MPTSLRWMILCAAAAALAAQVARAAGEPGPGTTPRSWTFWTAGQLQWAGSVGSYDPGMESNAPGMGVIARLCSPSGWALRAHLGTSRSNTAYTDIEYGSFVIPTVRDESEMVWALAGPQWETSSWRVAPHLYALAGAAVLHTRLHPQDWHLVYGGNESPWLRADVTAFATAIGAGVRLPLGSGQRIELTTDVDYRITAPINYVTSPVTDSSGNHLASKRSSVQVVSVLLGLGVRWGGD